MTMKYSSGFFFMIYQNPLEFRYLHILSNYFCSFLLLINVTKFKKHFRETIFPVFKKKQTSFPLFSWIPFLNTCILK